MTRPGPVAQGAEHYVPILKGRMGEFTALTQTRYDPSWMTPLIELAPTGITVNDEGDAVSGELEKSIDASLARLLKGWAPGRRMMLDASLLPTSEDYKDDDPIGMMLTRLHDLPYECPELVPVVRPSDQPEVLDSVARHRPEGAGIRLADDDLGDSDTPLAQMLEDVLDRLRLEPSSVDLVLDFGAVDERSISLAARIARLVLSGVPDPEEWRTLTVASGAFPAELNDVQAGVPKEIPRHDLEFWRSVISRVGGRIPSFGDYAIAHPALTVGAAFAPAPQLRYTGPDRWTVLKGRRSDRRGHTQIFEICQRLSVTQDFTRGASWGDNWIEERARAHAVGDFVTLKPGNATTWRAVGTSHHLAATINLLASEALL